MSIIQESRIKFFYEAVQHGSVRAAADFLNVAPSAVSRQISQLETELDAQLIERHRRGIRATEAGIEVLKYYKRYLQEQEVLSDQLLAFRGLQRGTIDLAIGEGYINLVTQVVATFSEKYPGINVHIWVHSGNDIIRKVIEDDVHFGIVFHPPTHPKIRSHHVANHPMVAAVNKQHPLNHAPLPLTMELLKRHRIAIPDTAHGIRHLIESIEHQYHTHLMPTLISNNINVLYSYAIHGGLTLTPNFVIQSLPDSDTYLNCLPLYEPEWHQTQTHIISRLGRHLGKAQSAFLKLFISHLIQEKNGSD